MEEIKIMQFLYDILAKALMELYILTGNFGLAIIAITILTKITSLNIIV